MKHNNISQGEKERGDLPTLCQHEELQRMVELRF